MRLAKTKQICHAFWRILVILLVNLMVLLMLKNQGAIF